MRVSAGKLPIRCSCSTMAWGTRLLRPSLFLRYRRPLPMPPCTTTTISILLMLLCLQLRSILHLHNSS